MTSCIGFAEMLLQKGDRMTPEERDEALRTIAKTGRRLVSLVEDLLEMARLQSGDSTYVMQPTDLNELVRTVLEERRPQLGDIEIEFDPGEDATVLADEARIHQVVANLLSNAHKFSLGKGPIRIAIRSGEGDVVLAVQDRGIGIEQADIAKLFTPFTRVPQPGVSEPVRGTGLGLHISKTIVDAHRGRIWVESEAGLGSTFFVALPSMP